MSISRILPISCDSNDIDSITSDEYLLYRVRVSPSILVLNLFPNFINLELFGFSIEYLVENVNSASPKVISVAPHTNSVVVVFLRAIASTNIRLSHVS